MASILIVDDDPTVRMIATELLRSDGYTITGAEDGYVAIQIIQAVPVDLMVLDILMPTMDGLEVIRSVKRDHPDIRILAISSGGKRAGAVTYLETARAFGADEMMIKPLRLNTFAATVSRLLEASATSHGPWAAIGRAT